LGDAFVYGAKTAAFCVVFWKSELKRGKYGWHGKNRGEGRSSAEKKPRPYGQRKKPATKSLMEEKESVFFVYFFNFALKPLNDFVGPKRLNFKRVELA